MTKVQSSPEKVLAEVKEIILSYEVDIRTEVDMKEIKDDLLFMTITRDSHFILTADPLNLTIYTPTTEVLDAEHFDSEADFLLSLRETLADAMKLWDC